MLERTTGNSTKRCDLCREKKIKCKVSEDGQHCEACMAKGLYNCRPSIRPVRYPATPAQIQRIQPASPPSQPQYTYTQQRHQQPQRPQPSQGGIETNGNNRHTMSQVNSFRPEQYQQQQRLQQSQIAAATFGNDRNSMPQQHGTAYPEFTPVTSAYPQSTWTMSNGHSGLDTDGHGQSRQSGIPTSTQTLPTLDPRSAFSTQSAYSSPYGFGVEGQYYDNHGMTEYERQDAYPAGSGGATGSQIPYDPEEVELDVDVFEELAPPRKDRRGPDARRIDRRRR